MVVGVGEEVGVPLPVALAVGVLLSEDELAVLPVFVLLGVLEGLEPKVLELAGETLIDELSVTVEEVVIHEEPVPDMVAEHVGVPEAVFCKEKPREIVAESVIEDASVTLVATLLLLVGEGEFEDVEEVAMLLVAVSE